MNVQDGRYIVTGRLFNIIDGFSHDKQFILYKQLVKDNIVPELFKLIIDLSEDEKYQLLGKLGGIVYADEPLKTINLDDSESFMRENPRKICLIPTTCKIEGRSFKSYIIDISKVDPVSSYRFAIDNNLYLGKPGDLFNFYIFGPGDISNCCSDCIGIVLKHIYLRSEHFDSEVTLYT